MRKIFSLVFLLTALSAFAYFEDGEVQTPGVCNNSVIDVAFCSSTTTTILPTIIIDDERVDLSEDEVGAFLISELEEKETPVTKAIATKLKVSINDIQKMVVFLENQGEVVTYKNLIAALAVWH